MELKKLCGKPRVIVIGAGISGLSAARRLYSSPAAARDWQITVLEASDRIGGRIFTSQFDTGEQIEIGATWIHGVEGSPIFDIAEKSGALHGDVPFECMDGFPEPPIVKAQGGVTVHSTIAHDVASLYRQLVDDVNDRRGEPPEVTAETLEHGDSGNLGSYLRRGFESFLGKQAATPAGVNAAELLLKQDNPSIASSGWNLRALQEGVFTIQENWERCVTAAESLHDLDLLAFNEYWEFPGEQITIGKGFSSVVQALAKSLPPDTIRFHKKVDKVVWTDVARTSASSGYPVQLHCEDGSTFEADHVIVTVSLGVLKAKALEEQQLFQPRLPDWKLDSIEKLGFGVVDKLFVLVEPPPDGSQHPNLQFIHKSQADADEDEVPRWMRKTHSLYPIHKKSNVLVAWFAGAEAKEMEKLSDEEIARGVQKTLAAFGDKRRVAGLGSQRQHCCNGGDASSNGGTHSGKVHVAHGCWNRNPLFLGSYSYVAVGSNGDDIDHLAAPVPRLSDSGPPLQLLFAGEATHRDQYSTTHGAYFSGQREADRLIQHYKFAS
ncbi:hypothetical protein SELMODRAFT_121066 [Selaginella moellendorffii]|uniref:Amine oxidase domain-containing protein n=1 Tax=Selaginella moellendorffii TaxID=88036 RepID=D8SNC0_SELML|nr:probable polyamine oxidase 5 isoform X1 [Selaginella moellendorffii]EFJ14046.1 hypothetical protein SELMODRAFT_121066 [Selaginella moellendorffii]|eukprot:XP_002984796.1 probable polyamine oxidase 5 isoform X1 [Selaginella moellendorffii]